MAASGVIPYFARSGSSFPCSMKRSGQPMRTTGVASPRPFSSSSKALPNPPLRTWSSSVRITSTVPAKNVQHLDIDRFGKAGIDDCRGDTFALQLAGDLFGH